MEWRSPDIELSISSSAVQIADDLLKGGSRVVQVISRNHSNVSKAAFISVRFFLVAQEIKYPSNCSVYYEIKQRKKAFNIALPSFTQQSHSLQNEFDECPFVRYRPLSRFPRTTRKNSWATPGQHLYAVGRTGWFMDLFTNHSKPSSIGQKHSHCLANYLNSVVLGYPGRKLPWKLLTIVYKGKPLPESPLARCCSD